MQLAALATQSTRAPQPIDPTPSDPTQPLLGNLHASDPVGAAAPISAARESAAALVGRVGTAQSRALESQQSIALVSATLGARLSALGSHVWSLLRGASADS